MGITSVEEVVSVAKEDRRDVGWKKVGLGITSVEEVVSVAKEDRRRFFS
ncbi:MAG: hypothetical protein J6K20_14300 [Thermoguttaceae bacterium]|nr:hypothetical protein [Thermoguttaceae bacterium]